MTKTTYENAINVLLDAYNGGKLFHQKCGACAVGNLLDGSRVWGCDFVTNDRGQQQEYSHSYKELWEDVMKSDGVDIRTWNRKQIREYVDKLYSDKGFTREELMTIEYNFESAIYNTDEGYEYWTYEDVRKEGQYMGLCAVLKVMETMVEEDVHQQAEDNMYRLQEIARGYQVTV